MTNAPLYPIALTRSGTLPSTRTPILFKYMKAGSFILSGMGLGAISVVIPFFQLFLPFVLPLVGVMMALNALK